LDTIFVQVAAFRDPEYLPTLHSLVGRAAKPGNIRVGAVAQYDWQEDRGWSSEGYPTGLSIKETQVEAARSGGICWAKSMAQEAYDGEHFTLQIDSHTRFTPAWDVKLLAMWRSLKNRKAVITHYAPIYRPGGGRARDSFSGMGALVWKKNTLCCWRTPTYSVNSPPQSPTVAAFASSHFLFGPGELINDVPCDPYLERYGEESSLAVRLWTKGYDLFHPNQVIVWHGESKTGQADYQSIPGCAEKIELSSKRCQALLSRAKFEDPRITVDLDRYGLGEARSLQEYEEWSGVNFEKQTFTKEAQQGLFLPFKRKSTELLAN
jgi:hypothetical protein